MTKVISLSDIAYERLFAMKGRNESFSDVVIKVTEKEMKKNLSEFAGKWMGGEEEITKIFNEIQKERERIKLSEVRL